MRILLFIFIFISIAASANESVWTKQVNKPLDTIYKPVYKGLEDANFFVVLEPNIGENLARFGKRWGDDYNRHGLTQIRSMVFCNGWYVNQVGNADPTMLALCPLHITLTEKDGSSTILFVRPSAVAAGSKAETIAAELEDKVITAITRALADIPPPASPATAPSASSGN